ncbi:helix-turn-helix domain-containing protein [Verminephrobacter aporrectodeae]|uniref:helix-turn-helix domain-containing protein n=1 Tax=Verminephrobacter aporrectodeae TaxID=1110389 RepID=UPI0022384ED2|nr:helix-turn-helix domain-containing protein [Verminephrobacter aporrectodeae]
MSKQDEDRGAAIKVLDVLDALSGHAVRGVSNTALSRQLNLTASAVTRAMGVLTDKGWARKDEATGHFHPTPRMGRVFGRVLADLNRAEQVLAEIRHNFTRTD